MSSHWPALPLHARRHRGIPPVPHATVDIGTHPPWDVENLRPRLPYEPNGAPNQTAQECRPSTIAPMLRPHSRRNTSEDAAAFTSHGKGDSPQDMLNSKNTNAHRGNSHHYRKSNPSCHPPTSSS